MSSIADNVIAINSEDAAWSALENILNGKIDCDKSILDFSQADWAKFDVKLTGDAFHQSITAATMRGFIEFQNAIYHSIGLIIHNDKRISLFSENEKEQFELVFKVKDGSSEVSADGKESIVAMAGKLVGSAVNNMDGKQTMIAVIVIALSFFGTKSLDFYVEKSFAGKKETEMTDLIKSLSASDTKKMEIMERASKLVPNVSDITERRDDAVDSIIKSTSRSDSISIQGKELSADVVGSIRRSSRRKAENTIIDGVYYVVGVDTTDDHSFRVTLEGRDDGGETVSAEVEDKIIFANAHKAIQAAQWQRRPLRVRMSARLIGTEIRNAKIIKATSIRRDPE